MFIRLLFANVTPIINKYILWLFVELKTNMSFKVVGLVKYNIWLLVTLKISVVRIDKEIGFDNTHKTLEIGSRRVLKSSGRPETV